MMPTFPAEEQLADLVTGVTQTMLGIAFRPAIFDDAAELKWRTAVLPIAGKVPITIGLSSDESGCAVLGAAMYACGRDALDRGMMNDALCELVNMTAGLVKTAMNLDQPLGLPKILDGRDADRFVTLGWPPVVLKADGLGLLLWLCTGVL